MRLRPLQIEGIIGVAVFGMILILQLLEPERDPFALPGAIPTGSDIGAPVIGAGSAPILDPLAAGPPDARDDLYCSGLLFAAHRATGDLTSPEAVARRDRVIALADSGVGKMITAGAADASQTGMIADAHAERALADFDAGTPRISVAECEVRGTRLVQ